MFSINTTEDMMKTYWSYEPKERSLLTDDDVRKLLDYELMEKGVAKVVAPEMLPVPAEVQVTKTVLFQIQSAGKYGRQSHALLFATVEDAQKAMTLIVGEEDHDYESGSQYVRPITDKTVTTVELISAEEHARVSATLKERKQAMDANEKARAQFAKDSKAQQDVLDKVWQDWHEQREFRAKCQRVRDTREEYIRMCDGDAEIAEKFLAKLYRPDEIADANEWFGVAAEGAA
jgi:hypothetical protein